MKGPGGRSRYLTDEESADGVHVFMDAEGAGTLTSLFVLHKPHVVRRPRPPEAPRVAVIPLHLIPSLPYFPL